ncbi:transposase family protein, partial [Deinococcus arenicola]|uniref:transposase family protein n=1 Tax=Deinococcus arenicola TaxID=2994950 RepID=UPI003D67BAE2
MATSIQPTSVCKECGTRSARIHSRYRRHLSDLPACGAAVTLELSVRRFVCQELSCRQQIFCERFVAGLFVGVGGRSQPFSMSRSCSVAMRVPHCSPGCSMKLLRFSGGRVRDDRHWRSSCPNREK